MKRLHLIELEDQQWFPKVVRDGMVDFLRFMIIKTEYYQPAIPIINDLINKTKNYNIIDLCSGGGGGIPAIEKQINAGRTNPVQFVLTDLYPNLNTFRYIKNHHPNIDFKEVPVDATNVPPHLNGIRSLFASFHHFRPEVAGAILRNAAANKVPIIIVDGAQKHLILKLIFISLSPIIVLFATPFIRPIKLSRLLFTNLIPLIPFGVLLDGIVSALRFYNKDEIQELIDAIEVEGYTFNSGILKGKADFIQYIIGFEK